MPDPVDSVVLEGDLVRVMRTELVREVRLQDFLPFIENRPPITLGLLPKTAVFAYWDESDPKNKRAQILAELAAGMYNCNYGRERYNLSMPWTYFLFDFATSGDPMEGRNWVRQNVRVFWAKDPVQNGNSELVTALVPNVDRQGIICWGTTGLDGNMPMGTYVDRTLDNFYRSQFTHSNGAGSPWQSETARDDWHRWAEETKKDPAAFLKFPEWDPKNGRKGGLHMEHLTVQKVMGSIGDRSRPIEVEGRIPEMVSPMTFGRAFEWLDSLPSKDLMQLDIGLANLKAEKPDRFKADKGTTIVPAR